jgi:hypothetical protein
VPPAAHLRPTMRAGAMQLHICPGTERCCTP